jgi:pectate lyase
LQAAIADDEPRIVQISGTISGSGPMLRVGSNKTIIGLGSSAGISGFGFNVSSDVSCYNGSVQTGDSNIIIRNLTFSNAADDSINVECFSRNVWIDHNTFNSASDGSVDIKRGSDWVTVSWNHFNNTNKTSLVGHDDGNAAQDTGRLHVTYHHNHFDTTGQRNPRVRYGQVHVFNNYAHDLGDYMIGLGVDCDVYSDYNYIERVEEVVDTYGGSDHTFTDTNILVEVEDAIVQNGQAFNPGSYYGYNPDPAADVPGLVIGGAGAGHL